jgi:hypothetical protein
MALDPFLVYSPLLLQQLDCLRPTPTGYHVDCQIPRKGRRKQEGRSPRHRGNKMSLLFNLTVYKVLFIARERERKGKQQQRQDDCNIQTRHQMPKVPTCETQLPCAVWIDTLITFISGLLVVGTLANPTGKPLHKFPSVIAWTNHFSVHVVDCGYKG